MLLAFSFFEDLLLGALGEAANKQLRQQLESSCPRLVGKIEEQSQHQVQKTRD
jgi:hypothetical protein